jgi:AcrR family transcriptional regulator
VTDTGRPLRSDASRNHEAILTAAIAVLADAPDASMAEVARASGTGRTTLYRHFPDRAALVRAIYERVLDEADTMTARRVAAAEADEDDDPVRVVAELCASLAGLGDRYRFLERHDAQLRSHHPAADRGTALREYLLRARASGRVRADVDADWQFAAIAALVAAGSGHVFPSAARRSAELAATITVLLRP